MSFPTRLLQTILRLYGFAGPASHRHRPAVQIGFRPSGVSRSGRFA